MLKIKKLALQWNLKYYSKKAFAVRKTVNYSDAKDVGILFYEDINIDIVIIKNFIDQLIADGKLVTTLIYSNEIKAVVENDFIYFSKKDISITGQIEGPILQNFINKDFDYLICFQGIDFPPFDFILRSSHAKCRVGIYNEKQINNFELMINDDLNKSSKELLDDILYYLKVMKS